MLLILNKLLSDLHRQVQWVVFPAFKSLHLSGEDNLGDKYRVAFCLCNPELCKWTEPETSLEESGRIWHEVNSDWEIPNIIIFLILAVTFDSPSVVFWRWLDSRLSCRRPIQEGTGNVQMAVMQLLDRLGQAFHARGTHSSRQPDSEYDPLTPNGLPDSEER